MYVYTYHHRCLTCIIIRRSNEFGAGLSTFLKHQTCTSSSSTNPPTFFDHPTPTHLASATNNITQTRQVIPPRSSNLNYIVSSSNKSMTNNIKYGHFDSAFRIFYNMITKTNVNSSKLKDVRQLFDQIPDPNIFSYNTMLACYLNNADIEAAKIFFHQIPLKDVASWNTMISGLCRNGMMNEAKELFMVMPKRNGITWNAMISGCVKGGDLVTALELFSKAPEKSVVTWTAMITGYMRFGKVNLAKKLFEEMPEKNLATWNAMISGYIENGRRLNGLKLFKTMIELGVKVNQLTLSSVFLGCSNLSELKFGMQVHQIVIKHPLHVDTTLATALISMYCKCGALEDARKLFVEMPVKDVVTWNAMISGYAQHGKGLKAIEVFNEMRKLGIIPNRITFVGVLSACNHAGLVNIGVEYFENMQSEYGIKPTCDHYTCMVDLFGRAGKLVEAVNMIKKMPFKPHVSAFGSLLGACRIHKNLEVGEFAAINLLNYNPKNAGGYVQLANLYAVKKRWESVSKVRKSMKENKVVKTPGYSWIEVKNVVHQFRSGDKVHYKLEDIHGILYELAKIMKLENEQL